jgi:hypothetical protein
MICTTSSGTLIVLFGTYVRWPHDSHFSRKQSVRNTRYVRRMTQDPNLTGPSAEHRDEDMSRTGFHHVRLRGSTFDGVDLSEVTIRNAWMADAEFRSVMFPRVRMRGVEFADSRISGEIGNLVINGVEVAPLIQAELDRRHPERAKMRPTTASGFREGWEIVEELWADTVEQARRLGPEQLHQSVDDEWSFVETLRHLAFVTDSWLSRAILGDGTPWNPLSLPWDEAPPTEGVPHDREAQPDLDTALALRLDRMRRVREYLDTLTDDQLAATTTPVEGPGWPEPRPYPVRDCLLTILNEEWQHHLYAKRDLDALVTGEVPIRDAHRPL